MGHDKLESGDRKNSLTFEDVVELFWWCTIGFLFELFAFGPLLAMFVGGHVGK